MIRMSLATVCVHHTWRPKNRNSRESLSVMSDLLCFEFSSYHREVLFVDYVVIIDDVMHDALHDTAENL